MQADPLQQNKDGLSPMDLCVNRLGGKLEKDKEEKLMEDPVTAPASPQTRHVCI